MGAAAGTGTGEPGSGQRERFVSLLKAEGRHSILEIGAGLGVDGLRFVRAGIHYTGVDPSEENVHLARSKGLDVSVASARQLPFADGTFPAVWAMNRVQHMPAGDIDGVLRELVRVTAPGAPIAVGLWSDENEERIRQVFGRHGAVEDFVSWQEAAGAESGPGAGIWAQHYEFVILRTPSWPGA
jgi:ubiquinone/menaquinone biosynthesis C-methylase UbiE